jgi:purine-binding chemotaxis protein CheW
MNSNMSAARARLASLAGKYMTFKLGAEQYGLDILKVRELIGLMEITRVPGTREAVRGVINLRGKVIPVLDLRLAFGMPENETTRHSVIIVVQFALGSSELTIGIVVDEVLEVRAISADSIEPTPEFCAKDSADYVLGIGRADKRLIFLIDIDRILTASQREAVAEIQR